MSNEVAVAKVKALGEIIENASDLPLECQELLLSIAKGMQFTKSCIDKEQARTKGDLQ